VEDPPRGSPSLLLIGNVLSRVAFDRIVSIGRSPVRPCLPMDGWLLKLLEPDFRAELARGYPLNLSILVRGGEGTNEDSPSNGE
jgi:hypothetical protein